MNKSNTSQTKNFTPLIILIATIAILLGVCFQNSNTDDGQQSGLSNDKADMLKSELVKAILLPSPKTITGVDFVDHHSKPFTLAQLDGKWSILFFGFTNCPDICPTTMHTLKQVKEKVNNENSWGNYQVIMVSVDPKRDTPERLENYVPFFDADFIGITGDLETTTNFAKQLGILFIAHDDEGTDSYDVDHGTSLILMNPKGEMAGIISTPHKVDEISKDLITIASYYPQDHQEASTSSNVLEQTPSISKSVVDEKSDLVISNAWIRPAPPTTNSMAAYFTLTNNSSNTINIVEANSPQFRMAMIHDTIIDNGIASMEHRDVLSMPAGESITLAPLGTHMMLVSPNEPLNLGETAQIVLLADDGKTYSTKIEVRPQPD